jgi:hypothetical protein
MDTTVWVLEVVEVVVEDKSSIFPFTTAVAVPGMLLPQQTVNVATWLAVL